MIRDVLPGDVVAVTFDELGLDDAAALEHGRCDAGDAEHQSCVRIG